LSDQQVWPLQPSWAAWISDHSILIELFFLVFFLLCLLAVVAKAYQNGEHPLNYDLFLICTIGAMIIPAVSIDYKLPLLAPPLALALAGRSMKSTGLKKISIILLIILISAAYSVTLFPFIDRPPLLANSLPMVLIILISITLLNFLDGSALAKYPPPENP
jgi:hypothetical protein